MLILCSHMLYKYKAMYTAWNYFQRAMLSVYPCGHYNKCSTFLSYEVVIVIGLFHYIAVHPPLRRGNHIQRGLFEQFNQFLEVPLVIYLVPWAPFFLLIYRGICYLKYPLHRALNLSRGVQQTFVNLQGVFLIDLTRGLNCPN